MINKFRPDPDKAALAVRAYLAAQRITQARVAKECEIDQNLLSGFLTRRLNLLDSQIERLFDFLGINVGILNAGVSTDAISTEK